MEQKLNMLDADFAQVIRAYLSGGTLVPDRYDEVEMTYAGPGIVETITYSLQGVEICTLTLTYDGDDVTNILREDV